MKKKYDFVFGIGAACLCSQMLRKMNLQFTSCPFDWLFGTDFSGRVDILTSGFADFINKEDLVFTGGQNGDEHNPCDIYTNTKNGLTFNHDFPHGVSLDDAYPAIRAKYDRRIARLMANIDRFRDILIVYVETPANTETTDAETLKKGYDKIVARFPDRNIDLLYIAVAGDRREEKIGEHILKLSFDYKKAGGIPPHDARVLRTAVKGIKVRQTIPDRWRHFVFKMKKRLKRLMK